MAGKSFLILSDPSRRKTMSLPLSFCSVNENVYFHVNSNIVEVTLKSHPAGTFK